LLATDVCPLSPPKSLSRGITLPNSSESAPALNVKVPSELKVYLSSYKPDDALAYAGACHHHGSGASFGPTPHVLVFFCSYSPCPSR